MQSDEGGYVAVDARTPVLKRPARRIGYNSNPNNIEVRKFMRLLNTRLSIALAFVAAALAALPAAAAQDTTEQRLANGMRVIVKPDERAPVVVVMVWYRVGSIDEVNGAT